MYFKLVLAVYWAHWLRASAIVEHNIFDSRRPKLISFVISNPNHLVSPWGQSQLPIPPLAIARLCSPVRLERTVCWRVHTALQNVIVGIFEILEFQESRLLDVHWIAGHANHLEGLVGGAQEKAIVRIFNSGIVVAQLLSFAPRTGSAFSKLIFTRSA